MSSFPFRARRTKTWEKPSPGSFERARHDRWPLFFAVNVCEAELRKLKPEYYTTDPASAESVRMAAKRHVEEHYLIYEGAPGEGPYFFGNWFTMIDIHVWMLAQRMPPEWLASNCPKTCRLSAEVARRPAIAPVHACHFADGA